MRYEDMPTEGYTTNRDGWTSIMGTMVLRQLGSWGAYLDDPSVATGDLDGEITTIDTVSGATKTSVPFISALNDAKEKGYIKSVSENVKLTIDGDNPANSKAIPGLVINNDEANNSFQDAVSVTKGDDGLYTVEGSFNKTGKGGRLSLDAIWLVNMGEQKLGTQGIMALAKEIVNVEDKPFWDNLVASYKPAKFNVQGEPHLVGFGATTDGMVSATEFKVSNDETVVLDPNIIEFSYEKKDASTLSFKIKVKDPNVTHVVMTYTLGHAKASSAYDLAEQLKVPEASALSEADTAAARAAYDKLDSAAKAKVDAAAVSALIRAEKQIAEAKEAAAAAEAKVSNGTVTVAKATYTGKALKPAVTVKSKSGKTLKSGTDYTVSYKNNVKVGKATVTVTGKGAYNGTKTATFSIAKAKNPVTIAKKTINAKASQLKKKAKTYSINKAKKAQGKVTYSITSAKKGKKSFKSKFSINKSTGKLTVKKGTAKGTYRVTVKATAKGNANYKSGYKTAVVTVKVK